MVVEISKGTAPRMALQPHLCEGNSLNEIIKLYLLLKMTRKSHWHGISVVVWTLGLILFFVPQIAEARRLKVRYFALTYSYYLLILNS